MIGRRGGDGIGDRLRVEIRAKRRELPIEQIVHEAIDLHLLGELI